MKISDIDKNLAVDAKVGDENTVFLDARQAPFTIHGVIPADETENYYRRMPQTVADSVSKGVSQLNHHTAGGRVRFRTDSPYVCIHTVQSCVTQMSHMAVCGIGGFDLYASADGEEHLYAGTFRPDFHMQDGYDSIVKLGDRRMRTITINMPLYGGVNELYIGLDKSAALEPAPAYRWGKPVAYYGSSITQGGCASRPGNSYQAILTRRLDCDHINLGFSGSGKGEQEVARHITSLKLSAFVMDYDCNSRTVESLKATHEPFFRTIREAQPDLPIIFVSRPPMLVREFSARRFEVIAQTYLNARASGDTNVYLVNGQQFYDEYAGDCATVDGLHPNDYGFVLMAKTLEPVLKKALMRESEKY